MLLRLSRQYGKGSTSSDVPEYVQAVKEVARPADSFQAGSNSTCLEPG